MSQAHIPTPLARAAMRIIPASILQRMIDTLMRSMRRNHPRLFQNLEHLNAAKLRIEPSDLRHRFTLTIGGGKTSLIVLDDDEGAFDARIKGKLDALLSLLEGRIDGDMLFFSRDIEITGNTAVFVALRNTIDREEINLLDDVTALFGPFAHPARRIVNLLDMATQRVQWRISEIVEEHSHASADAQATISECRNLRTEIQVLKTRLAKIEANRQRKEATAK